VLTWVSVRDLTCTGSSHLAGSLLKTFSFALRRAAHERRQPPDPPFTTTTETVVWSLITHTPQSHGRKTAITLTETRPQLLQRVRDVATLIRRCWCRRDAKHTRGACLGGRDRLPWRALGRARESEHTCGGVDARWVYTMRVAGGRGARCSRGCEVELIETLREMAA
jgi:hypothetical protein